METIKSLRDELAEAATAEVAPAERVALLESMRDELADALEEAEALLAEAQADPDAVAPVAVQIAIAGLRARAEEAQAAMDDGALTPEEIAEAGVLLPADLDDLNEEGLLESAAEEMIAAGRFGPDGDWIDQEAESTREAESSAVS